MIININLVITKYIHKLVNSFLKGNSYKLQALTPRN